MRNVANTCGAAPRRQRGLSTLFVAIALLLLLSVVTLFATSFGAFEQQVSGNEYRYKLAFQSAEAGLNQGAEFIKVNRRFITSTSSSGWRLPGSEQWQRCSDAKPAGMAVDPCLAEPDTARRANMFRYVGNVSPATGVLPLSSVLPASATQTFTSVGGDAAFAATYEVYATLCMLDGLEPPNCTASPPTTEDRYFVTIVSRGQLAGESSSATVKMTFGNYNVFPGEPAAPLVAASAAALGNAQIVPNPNGGGPGSGVPLSVWSSGNTDVSGGGSYSSCHVGEWMANYGNTAPSAANVLDGVCTTCSCNGLCPGFGLISGATTGCSGTTRLEGEDVLDVDNHAGTNRDSKYFPADLFEYTFGTPSSNAVTYLTSNATEITSCSSLNATSGQTSAMYWYRGATDCDLSGTIGSIDYPIILVTDKPASLGANGIFYGLLYIRYSSPGDSLKATGGPQFYGAILMEGTARINGNPQIIFNSKVFTNIGANSTVLAPVGGSWSDDVSR